MIKTSLLLLSSAVLVTASANAQQGHSDFSQHPIQHVLLISVDGMHAIDFKNCSQGIAGVNDGAPYCPNLAGLGSTALNYVAASTSKPSDSFPGLMSIVTGATPRTLGVYYDVAYDRSLDAPAKTTGNGVAAGPCKAGAPPTGTTTEYEEGIDLDQTKLNGGAPGAALTAIPRQAARRFGPGTLFAPTPSSVSSTPPGATPRGRTSTLPTPPYRVRAGITSMTSTLRRSTRP